MRTITIEVDKNVANFLERVNFELNFTKDIIQRLIESHPNNPDLINGETFRAYQKRGTELQAEYAIAAKEMEKQYIPDYLRCHQIKWELPNNSNVVTVNIMCNCEIPQLEGVENETH